MTIAKAPALLLALAAVVAAESSIISVFFPGADQQTLLGSIVKSLKPANRVVGGQDASKTTMAVGCPTDVDADDCGFPTPITVTVGPSTFYASEAYESTSAIIDCQLTGTTAGVCAETYVGPADLFEDTDTSLLTASDASSDDSITTTATTVTLSSTDMVYIPVTLTTGALQVISDSAASTGATGSESTPQVTGTTSSSGSQTAESTAATGSTTGSTNSGTTTSSGTSATGSSGSTNGASKGDSRMMACGAVGAAVVGLFSIMLL
ncbi:hypothetical protein EDD36DRAFT_423511 [Exophiala viscosa]|uniref:GPI anchored protein n=1 Tax=Exophiala viscosa TaxID=2486360 RepID=A0AAN6DKI3_9EURO|nr:hypothetical protein EDD36DRAFT_423511 [Exophiala viscosa]